MKIAIVTCNTGGVDDIKGFPTQNMEIEFHSFHDDNLPFPIPNLSPRMRARYIKIMMHRYIPEYDYYIWIDGRAEIISKDLTTEFISAIDGYDVAMFKHWERGTVESEMEFIEGKLNQGNHYLNSRYGNQSMDIERQFYIDNKVAFRQLYATTLFIRRNEKKVNAAFDEWFMRCIEFSHFDQTMYTYVELTHKLKTNPLEFEKFTKHILLNKHIK